MSSVVILLGRERSEVGSVKSRVRWMPALRMRESRVGWALVILGGEGR